MNETSVTAPDAMEEELKGDSIETTHVETNEIEKCSTFGSTEDNQKVEFLNKRIAKQFRVSSSNKIHKSMGGKVNKIFFGTVDCTIPGKEEKWRILYDDGDVDIMLRINVIDAIRYYAINKHYDTKITTSTTPQKMKREEGRGGCNAANISTNVKHTKTIKAKSTPPKRGKKIKGKAGKTETAPVWTGPPDEELDGGWPEGWVKKVFARKSGATKGATDRYWYSPKEKFKLRSMAQVKKFLKALKQTRGDEIKAKEKIG